MRFKVSICLTYLNLITCKILKLQLELRTLRFYANKIYATVHDLKMPKYYLGTVNGKNLIKSELILFFCVNNSFCVVAL